MTTVVCWKGENTQPWHIRESRRGSPRDNWLRKTRQRGVPGRTEEDGGKAPTVGRLRSLTRHRRPT